MSESKSIIEPKKRGRKPRLTEEQKELSSQMKRNRVKIAVLVSRKPEIKKICCLCGNKDAKILHSKNNNPYLITFLCDKCREDEQNLKKAEAYRFDIRQKMNKDKLSAKTFSDIDIKTIVENYLNEFLSIADYCDRIGITRHQFNGLVDRYKVMYEKPDMKKLILKHSNTVNGKKVADTKAKREHKNIK